MAPSQYRRSHAAERVSMSSSGSTNPSRRVAIVNPTPATKRDSQSHVAKILSRVNSLISESSDAESSDVKSDVVFEPKDDVAVLGLQGRMPHTIRLEIVELERRLSARLDSTVKRLKALEGAANATEDTAGAADKLGLQMAKLHAAVQDVAREKPSRAPPPNQQLREELRTEFNSRLEDLQAAVDRRLTDLQAAVDEQPALPAAALPPPPPRPAPFKDPDALEGMRAELSARHCELRREVDERLSALRAALEAVAQRPPPAAPVSGLAAPVQSLPARDGERALRFPREQSTPPNACSHSHDPTLLASASANVSLGAGSSGASSTEGFHPLASALSFSEARVGATALPSSLGETSAAGPGLQDSASRNRRARSPDLVAFPSSSSSSRLAKTGGGLGGEWDDAPVMREGRPRIEPIFSS